MLTDFSVSLFVSPPRRQPLNLPRPRKVAQPSRCDFYPSRPCFQLKSLEGLDCLKLQNGEDTCGESFRAPDGEGLRDSQPAHAGKTPGQRSALCLLPWGPQVGSICSKAGYATPGGGVIHSEAMSQMDKSLAIVVVKFSHPSTNQT